MDFLDQTIAALLQDNASFWLILSSAYFAGLLASLAPCVYPMIPLVAGVVGLNGQQHWTKNLLIATIYAGGLSLVYAALGLSASLTGSFFGTVQSGFWTNFLYGNMSLIFSLWILGVINIPVSDIFGRLGTGIPSPYLRAGVFGIGSGFVVAPCTAPVLGMLLIFVAKGGNAFEGAAFLTAFSFGMTSFLILMGTAAGTLKALPKNGRWMQFVNRGFGLLMIGSAEYFFLQAGKTLF